MTGVQTRRRLSVVLLIVAVLCLPIALLIGGFNGVTLLGVIAASAAIALVIAA
jgi:hypothetical protein